MLDRKNALDSVVKWCEEQVKALPALDITYWDEKLEAMMPQRVQNSVERELRLALRKWYWQNYREYGRGESFDHIMEWVMDGTVGVNQMDRPQLLDKIWEDMLKDWIGDSAAEGDELTMEEIFEDNSVFTPTDERENE